MPGGFIYIATVSVIPELLEGATLRQSIMEVRAGFVPLGNGKHLYLIYTREVIMLKVVQFSFVMMIDVHTGGCASSRRRYDGPHHPV